MGTIAKSVDPSERLPIVVRAEKDVLMVTSKLTLTNPGGGWHWGGGLEVKGLPSMEMGKARRFDLVWFERVNALGRFPLWSWMVLIMSFQMRSM